MNLIQTEKRVEERDERWLSRRLLERLLRVFGEPVLVIAFGGVVKIETARPASATNVHWGYTWLTLRLGCSKHVREPSLGPCRSRQGTCTTSCQTYSRENGCRHAPENTLQKLAVGWSHRGIDFPPMGAKILRRPYRLADDRERRLRG